MPARTSLADRFDLFDRTIAEAGHNDIYANPGFTPVMHQAMQALLAARR